VLIVASAVVFYEIKVPWNKEQKQELEQADLASCGRDVVAHTPSM